MSLSCSVSPFELLKHSLKELDYSTLTNQSFAGQSNHRADVFNCRSQLEKARKSTSTGSRDSTSMAILFYIFVFKIRRFGIHEYLRLTQQIRVIGAFTGSKSKPESLVIA